MGGKRRREGTLPTEQSETRSYMHKHTHTHTKTLFTAGEKEGVCEAAGADTTLRWLTVSLTKVVAN